MNSFADVRGNQVLWLDRNVLFIPGTNDIVGVVLGQCVFSRHGVIKGKYFNHTLYDVKGRIIAKECEVKNYSGYLFGGLIQNASFVLEKINKYQIGWITPGVKWINVPVLDLLTS